MRKSYQLLLLLLASGSLAAQTTFNYTGAAQTFTVPACVSTITVDARGASGGSGPTAPGGLGGRVQATIAVTPGEVLQIYVGQVGVNNIGSHPGVYNGGGGVYSYTSGGTSGTGGGGTDIRRAPYTVNDRLVVAGGGGGGGYQNTTGGHGGGLIGQDGTPYPTFLNSGGKGGSQIAGGAQGVACCSCPTYTSAGSLGLGGNGSGDGAGGGGGGGGYYGGGGACFAGGGGGSSYAEPSATAVTHTQGFQTGSGMVVISYTPGSMPASPTSIGGTTTVCAGSTGTFTINPVGGATSYTWTVPAGSAITSGQGTTSITVLFGSTSGAITVTADNVCGSSAPTTTAITISANPIVALGGDTTVCDALTLDAGNSGSTYLWSQGSTTQMLSVTTGGLYSVTVTTVNGCSSGDTIDVNVNTSPVASLGADITQCGGTATLDPQVSGATYLWNNNSTNQTLVASSSGNYYVMVTDANGCSDADTISVTINSLPVATANAANMLPCLADAPVALTGTPSGGTWSGTAVTGNSFDPATAGVGTYTLVYTYVDSLTTCSDTAQLNITVDICLGIQNNVVSTVTVFPNPVTNVLQVQTTTVLTGYVVLDINGRIAMKGNFSGNSQNKIDVSELPAGTYILRTSDNASSVQNIQFVKE